jgi:hypothetical protein
MADGLGIVIALQIGASGAEMMPSSYVWKGQDYTGSDDAQEKSYDKKLGTADQAE